MCAADADAKVAINARVVEGCFFKKKQNVKIFFWKCLFFLLFWLFIAKDPNAAPEPTEEELKSMTAASARLW